MSTHSQQRSSSRPSTPHRLINRSALVMQSPKQHFTIDGSVPLSDEQFIELADSFAVLDDNLSKINIINESIVKFNENFASLMYGLWANAYCTSFSEAPNTENFNETFYDLDSQIRLRQREIEEFVEMMDAERRTEKEKVMSSSKKVLGSNNSGSTISSQPGKKPLTSATLARLTKNKASISKPSYPSQTRMQSKASNLADASIMTNESFVDDPSSNHTNKMKRKHHFSTGGSSVPGSMDSHSRIPIRKSSASSKPAWK